MSPEEARIIRDVFERVRAFGPARDYDARAAVEAELRANPDAGVGLVQAIVGLERERLALEQRLAEYERGQDSQPSGGLFGGGGPWGRRDPAPQPGQGWQQQPQGNYQQPPQGYPQQQQPQAWNQPAQQQAPQQQRGGGLFGTLLGAATGLAAGYVGYEAMKGLFGGGHQTGGMFGGGEGGGGLFGGGDAGKDAAGGGGFLEERDRTSADDAAFFDNGGDFDVGGGGDDDSFA